MFPLSPQLYLSLLGSFVFLSHMKEQFQYGPKSPDILLRGTSRQHKCTKSTDDRAVPTEG